eukprot:351032-Chlamydomonas_euryale.AAC.3
MKVSGEDYILIREQDVIGIMPKSNAQADDIPELRPLADRVLVKVGSVVGAWECGGLPEANNGRMQSMNPSLLATCRLPTG